MAALRILLLTFTSRFVIDFLSIMHLSIACPTTPLTGLGGAIARRLQKICLLFRPQHRGLGQLQKMIEKVKVPAFSEREILQDHLVHSFL